MDRPLRHFTPSSSAGILLAMPFLTMGGAEAVVSQVCRQLKRAGFPIFVVTTVPTMANQGDTTKWFEDSAAAIYDLPRSLPSDRWKQFILDLVERNRIGLVWLIGSAFLYELLPELKQRFPGIAAVDLLFNPVGHTANHLKFATYIDHVTVEHRGMEEWLAERGRDRTQISVIPNGVDQTVFRRGPRRDWRTAAQRAENQPPFTLGFFGRLSEEKGPDIFVDLAARLRSCADVEFVMCGTGIMEAALREKIACEQLEDRVHLLGFRGTAETLPCCDALVVCSRLDGRPNIVMESLSMGVPVIASRVGGIPEMAPEGKGLILVEPNDLSALETAVRRLVEAPELRKSIAESGFLFAKSNFSSEASNARYETLFRDLVRAKQRQPAPQDGMWSWLRKLLS